MEHKDNTIAMLDLMPCPALCVQQGVIVHINSAAAAFPLTKGMQIAELLDTGVQEYSDFECGSLTLTLCIDGKKHSCTVNRLEQMDVFMLDRDAEQSELQALALAAQTLRSPLADIMTITDRLAAESDSPADQLGKLNRGLYQILRIVSNMSDAYLYDRIPEPRMEIRNIPAIFDELFEKVSNLLSHAGIQVQYTGLDEIVFGLADAQQLQRAVENLLANAAKFAPRGSTISAKLTRNGQMLYLTVLDEGDGIAESARTNFYDRYHRRPTLEDSRNGLGLGMVLVRSIAAAHGGTVLVQPGKDGGTKLTMSIAVRQSSDALVHSPILHVDYTGDRDHTLVELSETLPPELYK